MHSNDADKSSSNSMIILRSKLEASGEKERLRKNLRAQLIKCGWRDDMKELAKDIIRSRGVTRATVDEIVSELLPRGRASVPPHVKNSLYQQVRTFAQQR
mmetsp:Transcript_19699/g.23511  ORF Transcript_19699/g.23511 Transcript_19699/m.23511 type:complete len:100 (-) Transcript_19699:372-671(-)